MVASVRRAACGVWGVGNGRWRMVAEIMMLVNIIV